MDIQVAAIVTVRLVELNRHAVVNNTDVMSFEASDCATNENTTRWLSIVFRNRSLAQTDRV